LPWEIPFFWPRKSQLFGRGIISELEFGRVPEKELSSHMTRATIPREGDDREDRRGAVQTGGVGR